MRSLVILIIWSEEKTTLFGTSKSFPTHWIVNSIIISNTNGPVFIILKIDIQIMKNYLSIINLCSTFPSMMRGLFAARKSSLHEPEEVSYQDGFGGGSGMFLLGGLNMQHPL